MKSLLNFVLAAAVLVAFGCGREATKPEANDAPAPVVEDEHHHGAGPNGGTIAEWGGGVYHVEFTVDHDAKSTTVYVLGSDGETAEPIETDTLLLSINEPQFQVELIADPLPGESDGMTSRFVGTHENLSIVREFAGTISGEVEGTPYAGDFEEAAGHGH